MKAVILAGGFGTGLARQPGIKGNPMVEIGGQTIFWNLMKMYSAHGLNNFITFLG
jgi:glucose-1-phosphate cytidylyltransferase